MEALHWYKKERKLTKNIYSRKVGYGVAVQVFMFTAIVWVKLRCRDEKQDFLGEPHTQSVARCLCYILGFLTFYNIYL